MMIGSFVPAVPMVAVAPSPAVAEAYPAADPNPVAVEAYPAADPNPVVESARRPAYCRSWDKIWFLD